jgi:lysophospholipase L1-like esterase
MNRSKHLAVTAAWLALLSLTGCASGVKAGGSAGDAPWFTAWATAHDARAVSPALGGKTVRMVLVLSVSGTGVRVKLENTLGQSPVVFSSAFIGAEGKGAAVREGTNQRLTFAGKPGLTLAAGEGALSDPLPFAVKAFDRLTLSLDVESAADISVHRLGLRINWMASGAHAADTSAAGFEPLPEIGQLNSGQWPFYWVAGLDVQSNESKGTVVLLGDSITDGRCSTRDAQGKAQADLYVRWSDVLAARLAALPPNERMAVANVGIFGNRILDKGRGPSALERLDRDVLGRAGVTHVVLFEGTNDINGLFTAPQIIAAAQQAIDRVHAAGRKIIGVTVLPRGRPAPKPGWTSAAEAERLAFNEWVRTQARFDGVIDFDRLMSRGPVVTLADGGRAPAIPDEWNCDGTHPNTAGYRAMGDFIDLTLLAGKR